MSRAESTDGGLTTEERDALEEVAQSDDPWADAVRAVLDALDEVNDA